MFEHHHEPLLPRKAFIRRQALHAAVTITLFGGSLLIGMGGYHFTEDLSWLDSFVNASMILGGMGPVDPLHTTAGKVFAGCYALFSGIVFLMGAAVLAAPAFHRFLHRFHLEAEGGDDDDKAETRP